MPLPNVLRTITNALVRVYPEPMSRDDLIAAIYRGSKQPASATKALRVQLTRLRDKLAVRGWTVSKSVAGAGNVAEYRLEARPNIHV